MSLQSPFKSGPAEPHTTREDANSVISSDSGSAKRLREVTNNGNGSATPTIDEFEGEKSPKVISFRKKLPPQPETSFDQNLYDEDFFNQTIYRLASMRRNVEYHQTFKQLDLTDRLLDDYSCAMSREILLQGRMYISGMYVCFNSNLLGWVTNIVIKIDSILNIEKKSTAGLFPNGITIDTEETKYTFASFVSRDATFDLLMSVWNEAGGPPATAQEQLEARDSRAGSVSSGSETATKSPRLANYLMQLDGDDSDASNETTTVTPVCRFKPNSHYTNHGPDCHAPTTAELVEIENEEILFEKDIDAPMGVVYEILFGTNTRFSRRFLENHDSSEITEYKGLDASHTRREYNYRKALNFSIGPKSTRCEVTEEVISHDYNSYITVDSTTKTPDVPSGNSFSVHTRYVLTWGDNNTTHFRLSFYIVWTGSSWIKSVIEKSSLAGQRSAADDLLDALMEEINEVTVVTDAAPQLEVASAAIIEPVQLKHVAPVVPVVTAPVLSRLELSTGVSLALAVIIFLLLAVVFLQWQILVTTQAQLIALQHNSFN